MWKALIVDDHPLFAQAMRQLLLASSLSFEVCATVTNESDALDAVHAHHPDIVLVDLSLDGGDGLSLVERIRGAHTQIRILVVSGRGEEIFASLALRAGADGFVPKSLRPDQILAAVEKVAQGKRFVRPEAAHHLIDEKRPGLGLLSGREHAVLELLGVGQTNVEIADTLGIKRATIEVHVRNIRSKLDKRSVAELRQFAAVLALTGDRSEK